MSMTLEQAQEQLGPGKFEGQEVWVPAAYEDTLDGCWETETEPGYHHSWVEVDDDVRALCFGLLDEDAFAVWITQDDQGFIDGNAMNEEDHLQSLANFQALYEAGSED